MTDLRQVVARAAIKASETAGKPKGSHQRNVPLSEGAAQDIADAVLAAVRGAVGEDVVEAMAEALYLSRFGGKPAYTWADPYFPKETWDRIRKDARAMAPFALAARDAALEEAGEVALVQARQGATAWQIRDAIRALKGGPARG